ncbi:MAG: NAD-dependent epimerase/dehydratase family protein [Deinococcus sp.]|nr:NAD-dependent epimerase/dehydratase family protein [Deinococcus sp.]
MRIAVTGGAGFIGSHVVDALLALGHTVAVVDDLSSGQRENLPGQVLLYEQDICHPGLGEFFRAQGTQVVIHHAAQISVAQSVKNPLHDAQVNVLGSLNVAQACAQAGVGKLIFASTGGALYGEAAERGSTESDPTRPISPYGASKRAFEGYLPFYAAQHHLRYTVLRYANVYGPRQDPHGEAGVVAIFAQRLLHSQPCTLYARERPGDGGCVRDYVYVSDVARANVAVLEKGDGETYNIGSSQPVTTARVYALVAAAAGSKAQPIQAGPRPGDLQRSRLDCSKAARELGWQPQVGLEQGIAQTVEYFRQRG